MGASRLSLIQPDAPPGKSADDRDGAVEAALRPDFTLLELIGGGGMSRVHLARDHRLDRLVAIKLLRSELCDRRAERERFRREARMLASLRHPGIMPVFALGEAAGIPYFVMPYVPGPCLARRIAAGPRLSEREASALVSSLADAVAAAHAAGIVHRDIKAENVLLEDGRPILADFGVATLHTSDHSRSELSLGLGTVACMAPEQLLGRPDSDGRSDVYSLGVLAFQLLTGRPPFGGTGRELAAQHIARPAPRVSIFRPGVSPQLDDVVLRCLAKEPSQRYPSAAALRDELRALAVARAAGGSRGWRDRWLRWPA
jgi:serine/threonine-protein kinase